MTNYSTSGNGSQDIYGTYTANTGASNRNLQFNVTYCSGLIKTFTFIQGLGVSGSTSTLVVSNNILSLLSEIAG
jgi:hypothetical protein